MGHLADLEQSWLEIPCLTFRGTTRQKAPKVLCETEAQPNQETQDSKSSAGGPSCH